MNAHSAQKLQHFNARLYEPATFLDRGVALPFTTPMLLGARARPEADQSGLEVIIPNPSGGDGVYILPWAAIPQICTPTLHDRRLWHLLRSETVLTPRLVREATETAALEGLAGRQAASAVRDARQARDARGKRINFALLLNLIKQMEGPDPRRPAPELDDPRQLKIRGQNAVLHCGQQLRMTTEAVATALEELAKAFNGFGLPQDTEPAPARLMLSNLGALAETLAAWRADLPEGTEASTARLLQESLELSLQCALQAAEEFDALIGDSLTAIDAWRRDAADVTQRLTRLDWLLDGWEMIWGIWNAAPAHEKANAVLEMALLAPILPKEITGWFGVNVDWAKAQRNVRIVQQFEDWRSGRVIDMIARNETLIHNQGQSRVRLQASQVKRPTTQAPRGAMPGSAKPNAPAPGNAPKPLGKTKLAETRQLVHALAAASDMALTQVIEILDRLPDRLEADRLLDAARPRLRQLRPLRKLQFTRLLFLPLDGSIVDNGAWKRGEPRLPRCALPGIAEALRLAMGEEAAQLEAGFAGKTFQDLGSVDRAGRALWAAAAAQGPQLKPGPRWDNAGLRAEDFAPLVNLAVPVWRHANGLWAAIQKAGWGPPEEAVRSALAPMAAEPGPVFAMGLATLMQKATSPGSVAMAAAGLSDRAGSIADAAVDEWLGGARVTLATEDLAAAALSAESFGRAFQDLENAPTTRNPKRAERLVQLRQEAEEACRLAYEQGLDAEILRQLPFLCTAATAEQINALETQARALRRIELIGRRYGIDHGYEGAAKRIGVAIHEAKQKLEPGGLTRLDLARMAEILLGTEAALDVLG